MTTLTAHVRFIAHSYSGVRIGPDRREVLDWPPSPARLHEALLSAALVGLPRPEAEEAEVWKAFRWLEALPPPVVFASPHNEKARSNSRLAIPQNNPAGTSKLHAHSTLLAPTLKISLEAGVPLEVFYCWELDDVCGGAGLTPCSSHIAILADAAARVSYLGRGEDRAEVTLQCGMGVPPAASLLRHCPDQAPGPTNGGELWTVRKGSTDALKRRHETHVPARETRPPAQRFFTLTRYSDGAPRARQPIAISLFQFLPEDDNPDARPLDCDAPSGGLWREKIRHRICALAKETAYWDDPALASALLAGHGEGGPGEIKNAESRQHLAIVPLPSLNFSNTADGRIRRVALLGYAPDGIDKAVAKEIYETAFVTLVNAEVPVRRGVTRLVRVAPDEDAIWCFLSGASQVWNSIIPVAIARHFKTPRFAADGKTPLSENESIRRRNADLAVLLRKCLRDIGIPDDLAAACRIELTPSPLVPRTERAERYRPPSEKAFITHCRIEFPRHIRGPLLLGDRRYFGFGLFAPGL